MSGFDVRLADAHRSRALVFFATLTVALLLVAAILISRTMSGTSASAAAPEYDALDPVGSALMAEAAEAAPSLDDMVMAEHAAFTNCMDCPVLLATEVTVRSGQTFASVLSDAGASRVDAARAIAALDPVYPARSLRAGQSLNLFFERDPLQRISADDETGLTLTGISFRPDSERTLTVARSADGSYRTREAVMTVEREIVRATGEITSSLYAAALEAGATDRIVTDMALVLGHAVDFRTIRYGDTFDIVFERYTNRAGEVIRTGNILYMTFAGRGNPLEYFRFEAEDGDIGYYTAEGESAARLLMKMPINGARISSQFGMRFHPIRRTNRPHNGTDFAAPTGTPIYAAGNGTVERADWFGTFGNYIRLRHSNGYQTVYAHLNSIARGVRAGTRVTQGQTIGYVGTTGASTGPHLHYEVHLNGRPMNPMSLELPTGRRLEADELGVFGVERDRIIALRDQAAPANGDAERENMLVAERSERRASSGSGASGLR
ncbi:MAG: peptidoglycan DD-metalloendopeptidase family protein [Caulobacterales bacterium]|uniref:M23 family metallopeptidase n=1 Tax=Glycocaulis sp. TaxID=1969725 RepID=UPI003F9EE45B